MNNSNQQTIASYEAHVQEYIDGTPQTVSGTVKEWLDEALRDLPQTARILELGSAFGRDAAYLQEHDYTVDCTDATPAFVQLLAEKGFSSSKLNAITDPIPNNYDLVLANAVLLHFTREETKTVLRKIQGALNNNGRFAFTLKQGNGEKWSEYKLGSPRYFCFWTEDQIAETLAAADFSHYKISTDKSTKNALWLQIIAHK